MESPPPPPAEIWTNPVVFSMQFQTRPAMGTVQQICAFPHSGWTTVSQTAIILNALHSWLHVHSFECSCLTWKITYFIPPVSTFFAWPGKSHKCSFKELEAEFRRLPKFSWARKIRYWKEPNVRWVGGSRPFGGGAAVFQSCLFCRCGLVALWMAAQLLQHPPVVSMERVVHTAIQRGYTAQGEVFSGGAAVCFVLSIQQQHFSAWLERKTWLNHVRVCALAQDMAKLAEEVCGCHAEHLSGGMGGANSTRILRHLSAGFPVLIPYPWLPQTQLQGYHNYNYI